MVSFFDRFNESWLYYPILFECTFYFNTNLVDLRIIFYVDYDILDNSDSNFLFIFYALDNIIPVFFKNFMNYFARIYDSS